MCAFASEGVVNAKTSHDDSASRETQQRFESAKRMSLELAKTIADSSCRDSALHCIIGLCMEAKAIESARILVRGIQGSVLPDQLLEEHPIFSSERWENARREIGSPLALQAS